MMDGHLALQPGVGGWQIMLIFYYYAMLAMLIILIIMLLKTSYYAQHYAHRQGPKVTSITTPSCTHDRLP